MTSAIKLLLIAALLILFVAVNLLWDWREILHPEAIAQWLNGFGAAAPLVFMAVMALAIVISPIPSLPLDIAAGLLFGPYLGTLYAAVGALIGAIISFLLGRLLGRQFIERFLKGHINFCTHCSNKLLIKIVFLSRLIPVVSFDVISYGAGLTKMSLVTFSLATFFGMLPLTFAYTTFGASFSLGFNLSTILALIVVVLFFFIPQVIEKKSWMRIDHLVNETKSKR